MTPFDYASAFVAAIASDPIMDWRAIHDTDKEVPGHARRGTLTEWWEWLTSMNQQGYGIFVTPAMMDGVGRELANVSYIRAHYVDLDNMSAQQNYERAAASVPPPAFSVNTSPGKFHVYWPVQPYQGNDRFQVMQRKLRQVFDGDKRVIDAARVMRLPGTYHLKGEPHLVTCSALAGYGQPLTIEQLEAAYGAVNIIDGGAGVRHDLGDPELAAPSLDWLRYALQLIDPNDLDRGDWIAMTSAIKQAGWSLTDPDSLMAMWSEWCARYTANDPGENLKQWNSIRNTELGWHSLVKRVPSLRAAVSFGAGQQQQAVAAAPVATVPEMPGPPALDCSGEYLTHLEQKEWFKGCVFVVKLGQVLAPDGRFLNASQFNVAYGGKRFIIDGEGKKTDEPWKAAFRSTLWQMPKVDHIRFLPHLEHGAIVKDELGRKGVNVYKPAEVALIQGDPTPFLQHIAYLLPDPNDQRILIEFLAHTVKYPGFKIPWAPVIQSVEGGGKGIIKEVMTHALGKIYVHFPNAKELTNSGSQFNGWMRNKLFILADEIKVDDKRDLIEVLKPLISEKLIEVQSKGVDQELEDNYTVWVFFTNYKDAVPVSKNGRRYAIFYSPLQTERELLDRGLDETYFNRLYAWLAGDGAAIVTDWLRKYPIERGAIPMRAPKTSSWEEAVKIGRSPIERVIAEAVEQGLPGFRGGWISSTSALRRIKDVGAARGNVPPHVVAGVVESMGYVISGTAPRAFFAEAPGEAMPVPSDLFHYGAPGDVEQFGRMQGWE